MEHMPKADSKVSKTSSAKVKPLMLGIMIENQDVRYSQQSHLPLFYRLSKRSQETRAYSKKNSKNNNLNKSKEVKCRHKLNSMTQSTTSKMLNMERILDTET
jgi:hypothetical protein